MRPSAFAIWISCLFLGLSFASADEISWQRVKIDDTFQSEGVAIADVNVQKTNESRFLSGYGSDGALVGQRVLLDLARLENDRYPGVLVDIVVEEDRIKELLLLGSRMCLSQT